MSFSIIVDEDLRAFNTLEELLEECFPGEDFFMLAHYEKGDREWYHVTWDLCSFTHNILRIEHPHYIDNIQLVAYYLKPDKTTDHAWILTKSP